MEKKVRVLIVDDSALVRQALTEVFSQDPEIELIGTAGDPFVAARKIRDIVPDVITLDVEMPRMDGLTFLKKIMAQHPIPVVICSSLAGEKTETAIRALQLGAIEIIEKPKLGTKQFFRESAIRICDTVKAASMAKAGQKTALSRSVQPKLGADAILAGAGSKAMVETTEKIVVVGASTGGTEALRVFLEVLPQDAPAIAVVQHMPEKFTRAFANRLNNICRVNVKEAENNDSLLRGSVLIAPGNCHMLVKRSGARYYVETREGPLVSRHRPSVDVLFRSAARYGGKNVIGVIMTGMGDDGAQGMLEMKNAGARNFAQDEATCVVFGMPKEAVKKGAVDVQLPLESLAEAVLKAAVSP